MSPLPYLISGISYDVCNWCNGHGENENSNPCENCRGGGLVEAEHGINCDCHACDPDGDWIGRQEIEP